jgi:hypothetical protein
LLCYEAVKRAWIAWLSSLGIVIAIIGVATVIWMSWMGPRHVDVDGDVDRALAARPDLRVPGVVRSTIRTFYARRAFAPAWIQVGGPLPSATDAVSLLEHASTQGLDPVNYDARRLRADLERLNAARDTSPASMSEMMPFEVQLTGAVLSYRYDLAHRAPNGTAAAASLTDDLPTLVKPQP